MSGSAACWWPKDDAAAPTADPNAPLAAVPPDDIALEARLPAPAAIESYQAPCRVGPYGSAGASTGSILESARAWAARCTAMPGCGGNGRPGLRLDQVSFPPCRRALGEDASVHWSGSTAPAG